MTTAALFETNIPRKDMASQKEGSLPTNNFQRWTGGYLQRKRPHLIGNGLMTAPYALETMGL